MPAKLSQQTKPKKTAVKKKSTASKAKSNTKKPLTKKQIKEIVGSVVGVVGALGLGGAGLGYYYKNKNGDAAKQPEGKRADTTQVEPLVEKKGKGTAQGGRRWMGYPPYST